MTKFLLALVAAGFVAAPALAAEPVKYSFQRDGLTYNVSQTTVGDKIMISGKDSKGRAFQFEVRGREVTGTYDNEPAAFTIARPLTQRIAMN